MSGHSKWATTKRAKAVVDAKRGAAFTKISNLISIAAREKGGDVQTNFSLRLAIDKAKAVNMPKENIERAIKRGTGALAGGTIEELVYEGIGPAKSQFIIKCLTDNRNRAAANVRHFFTKYGGSFTPVLWNFALRGVIMITAEELAAKKVTMDDMELDLIDAGMGDVLDEADGVTIYTKPEDLAAVKQFLENRKITIEHAAIEYVAKEKINITKAEDVEHVEKFIDAVEGDEDVSEYYTNAQF